MWKQIRILILLLVLFGVAWSTYVARENARDWTGTVQISIFPINGDGSPLTAARIASLTPEHFEDIERFLILAAQEHGVSNVQPVRVTLQPALSSLPPPPPSQLNGLPVVWWSLQTRWWAWRQPGGTPHANIRAFVVYWDSARSGGRVPSSHGLAKGQVAISNVHVDAQMQRANNVVIAHEILHAMGATDKYDFASLMPIYPLGYAEPQREPRLPQRFCEIMAGRIPLGEGRAEQPRSLAQCVVGGATALEIGLRKP